MAEYSLNVQRILSKIGGFDTLGDHPSQIDTKKEYNLLGQYLNGSYKLEDFDVNSLNKREKKDLNKILKQLQKKWGELTGEKVDQNVVTRENLKKYLDKYNQLEYIPPMDLSEEELKYAKCELNRVLEAFMKEIGLPEPYMGDYAFQIEERLRVVDFINEAEKNSESTLENIKNPQSKEVLEAKVKEYLSANTLVSINVPIDTGDGDFNEVVHQKTNVCWGLGAINSLVQSEIGRSILDNNYYRDETSGVCAIRLKEAENCNLPSGGVYIITPLEIADASQSIAEGEGDSVAYLLAIDKYFEELKASKPELAENMNVDDIKNGNLSSRFFEIVTGGSATMIGELSSVNYEIPKGINLGNGISYDQILEIVQSGRGAAVLSVRLGYEDMGHAISVVGAQGGKLVIQESYNDSELFTSAYKDHKNRNIFVPITTINGAPAYVISKENFEMYTTTRSVIRWE